MEAFSDGVFAIAITLLVLEISVPEDAGDDLLHAFLAQWPSYLAYVVSFATIGATWLSHSTITEYLDEVDAVFVRLNLLLLLVVSFLPFPTKLLASYIGESGPERVAATIYGLTLLAVGTMLAVVWIYAVNHKLVADDMSEYEARVLTRRLTPGGGGYVVLVVVGLFAPIAAVFGYLVIAFGLMVPVRRPDGGRRPARGRGRRRGDAPAGDA
nr:TMEM175 family protein [Petropleomorpha daqingensis]